MQITTRIGRFKNAACQEAKHGKMQLRFTIYVNEVKALEEEGFGLKLPKNFQSMDPKSLVRVAADWSNPTTGGMAKHCKKLAEKYRYRDTAYKRKRKVGADRQLVSMQRAILDEEYKALLEENESADTAANE